jgi:hypothetical protein
MNQDEQFMSLYDYLGYAAGVKLGGEVYQAARIANQPTRIREVSNSKYKGEITLYTKSFLDSYFNTPQVDTTSIDNELPF